MIHIPHQSGERLRQDNMGGVGTATLGTAVTTGASASTKGTPAELFSATDFDTDRVIIIASNYGLSATNSAGSLDILIGAATESILIPDLLMGYCGAIGQLGAGPKIWDFPLHIPAGSRIAAQAAGDRTSTAMQVGMILYGGGLPFGPVGTKVTTYGMGTVPTGTAITPGASGAAGAWTQIAAATTEDHFALIPSFQINNDTSMSVRAYALQLGVGATTEEQLAETYWYAMDGNEFIAGPIIATPAYRNIITGTRLAVRASDSGANDAGYSVVIHAMSH